MSSFILTLTLLVYFESRRSNLLNIYEIDIFLRKMPNNFPLLNSRSNAFDHRKITYNVALNLMHILYPVSCFLYPCLSNFGLISFANILNFYFSIKVEGGFIPTKTMISEKNSKNTNFLRIIIWYIIFTQNVS